jgi:hypothetical protein
MMKISDRSRARKNEGSQGINVQRKKIAVTLHPIPPAETTVSAL